jgi:hypothetical protein
MKRSAVAAGLRGALKYRRIAMKKEVEKGVGKLENVRTCRNSVKPQAKERKMTYLRTVPPEEATGKVKKAYDTLHEMSGLVPQVYIAQSIRPDLLELIVLYNKGLMAETHALTRRTKELIAAYVSKLNSCEY